MTAIFWAVAVAVLLHWISDFDDELTEDTGPH